MVWSRIGTGLCPESYESYTPCRPCFCKIHFNIILPSRSCLQSRHFVLHFLQNSIRMSLSSHACHMPCPSRPSLFVRPDNIWRGVEIMKILIMQFPAASHYAPPLTMRYFPWRLALYTLFRQSVPFVQHQGPCFTPIRKNQIYNFVYSNICLV